MTTQFVVERVDDLISEINAPLESAMASPTPHKVVGILEAFLPTPENFRGQLRRETEGPGQGLGLRSIRLGEMYESYGVTSYDEAQAVNPLKTSLPNEQLLHLYAQLRYDALDHDAEALNDLGWLWLEGAFVVENPSVASQLFRLAAGEGLSEAFYNLGQLYAYGLGVDTDEHAAKAWFKRAFDAGIREGALEIAWLYDQRDRKGAVHASRVEADKKKAFRWYRKAANASDCRAYARLGRSYLDGDGVSLNVPKGFYWLHRAALSGDAVAADLLEYFFEDALHMPDPQGRMRAYWAAFAADLRAVE